VTLFEAGPGLSGCVVEGAPFLIKLCWCTFSGVCWWGLGGTQRDFPGKLSVFGLGFGTLLGPEETPVGGVFFSGCSWLGPSNAFGGFAGCDDLWVVGCGGGCGWVGVWWCVECCIVDASILFCVVFVVK
jgi:hypothetical protein